MSKIASVVPRKYTQQQKVLNKLVTELLPYTRRKARQAAWRALRQGVFMPHEDLESSFLLAVLDAAKSYELIVCNPICELTTKLDPALESK